MGEEGDIEMNGDFAGIGGDELFESRDAVDFVGCDFDGDEALFERDVVGFDGLRDGGIGIFGVCGFGEGAERRVEFLDDRGWGGCHGCGDADGIFIARETKEQGCGEIAGFEFCHWFFSISSML